MIKRKLPFQWLFILYAITFYISVLLNSFNVNMDVWFLHQVKEEDWSDWLEPPAQAICLFCDFSSSDLPTLSTHITDHGFDFASFQQHFGFYQQVSISYLFPFSVVKSIFQYYETWPKVILHFLLGQTFHVSYQNELNAIARRLKRFRQVSLALTVHNVPVYHVFLSFNCSFRFFLGFKSFYMPIIFVCSGRSRLSTTYEGNCTRISASSAIFHTLELTSSRSTWSPNST